MNIWKLLQAVEKVDNWYIINSKKDAELERRIIDIWGEDWYQMKGILLGTDYENNCCEFSIPSKLFDDMVERLTERLFVFMEVVKFYDNSTKTYYEKEFAPNVGVIINEYGLYDDCVESYNIIEVEDTFNNRNESAESLYKKHITK